MYLISQYDDGRREVATPNDIRTFQRLFADIMREFELHSDVERIVAYTDDGKPLFTVLRNEQFKTWETRGGGASFARPGEVWANKEPQLC